jgi:hypothetical protein
LLGQLTYEVCIYLAQPLSDYVVFPTLPASAPDTTA